MRFIEKCYLGLHRRKIDPKLPEGASAGFMNVLDRRNIVRALAGLLGAATLGTHVVLRDSLSGSDDVECWLRREGARVLGDTATLSHFGEVYLLEHPQESNRGVLSQLLAGGETSTIRLRLLSAIARDWSEASVVVASGWVFARTEARICALLHLIGDAPE